jgi:hypothetical protein
MPTKPQPIDKVRERFLECMNDIMKKRPELKPLKKFAAALPAPYVSIRRVAKEGALPTLENVECMCRVFGISPDYIITERGGMYGKKERPSLLQDLKKLVNKHEKNH